MELPVNFTIAVDNEDDLSIIERLKNDPEFAALFQKGQYRRKNGAEARVLLNGGEIASGSWGDMSHRFRTECSISHNVNVQLQLWSDGTFKTISSRMLQKI